MYSNINEQSLRGRLYKFTFCLALLFEDAPNLPFHMRTNGCQYYKKKKKRIPYLRAGRRISKKQTKGRPWTVFPFPYPK